MADLDIIIPVYNEGVNIVSVLDSLYTHVKTPFRVLICYDFDKDNTLDVIAGYPAGRIETVLVKNPGSGAHRAIRAGLEASTAPAVLTHMADDDFNAEIIDKMVALFNEGCDVVTGSRFMKGGSMVGCVWHKMILTRMASFTLYHFAGLPVHDATNGVRLFSRRLLDTVEIESSVGFTFSFEMMVKVARLRWKVSEIPCKWIERTVGDSRFQLFKWISPYLRWYFYAFATTWLNKGPKSVRLRNN